MISRVASIRKCLPRPQLLGAVNLDRISHRSVEQRALRMALSSSSVGGDPTVKADANHPNREFLERSATPLSEKESSKSFLQRIWDRYSIAQQTSRILAAESYLQAATRQASDPWVNLCFSILEFFRRDFHRWIFIHLIYCLTNHCCIAYFQYCLGAHP